MIYRVNDVRVSKRQFESILVRECTNEDIPIENAINQLNENTIFLTEDCTFETFKRPHRAGNASIRKLYI